MSVLTFAVPNDKINRFNIHQSGLTRNSSGLICISSPRRNAGRLSSLDVLASLFQVWFRGVRSSKFRHVYGEPAKREKCYDNIKITKNAHDSQFCAVNPKFVAIVTEVAGGGAFVVLPIDRVRFFEREGKIRGWLYSPLNQNVTIFAFIKTSIGQIQIPKPKLGSS